MAATPIRPRAKKYEAVFRESLMRYFSFSLVCGQPVRCETDPGSKGPWYANFKPWLPLFFRPVCIEGRLMDRRWGKAVLVFDRGELLGSRNSCRWPSVLSECCARGPKPCARLNSNACPTPFDTWGGPDALSRADPSASACFCSMHRDCTTATHCSVLIGLLLQKNDFACPLARLGQQRAMHGRVGKKAVHIYDQLTLHLPSRSHIA